MINILFANKKYPLALILIIIVLITSCVKNNNNERICSLEDNKNYSIFSLFLGKDHTITNYISFSTKGLVKNNEHWDFSTSGIYNSNLNANTQNSGRLNYIDLAYNDISAQDILNKFNATKENFLDKFTNIDDFGLHKSSYNNNKEGWLNYTGSPDHLVNVVKDRSILILTTNPTNNTKKLYKMQIISMYKCGILNPTTADNKLIPYITCNFEEIPTEGIIDL